MGKKNYFYYSVLYIYTWVKFMDSPATEWKTKNSPDRHTPAVFVS